MTTIEPRDRHGVRRRAGVLACIITSACFNGSEASAPEGKSALEAKAEVEARTGLPAAEDLLEKAVVASGGREAFAAIRSYRSTADMTLEKQNIRGTAEQWAAGDDYYLRQDVPGMGVIEGGKLGDVHWTRDPFFGLRKLEGLEAEQNAWASSLLLEAEWQRFFDEAETVGKRTADGVELYDVELRSKTGSKVTVSFDAASGLPREKSFEQVTPMGTTPVRERSEDFREIAGLELPFRRVLDLSLSVAELRVKTIEVNVDVDRSKFAMPSAAAEVVNGAEMKGPEMKGPEMKGPDEKRGDAEAASGDRGGNGR